MGDYISREAALKAIKFAEPDCEYEAVEAVPSADVVEVVRCKDCVHYMPYDWMYSEVWQSQNIEDYPQNEIGCEWIDHNVKPDGYCHWGERKDD